MPKEESFPMPLKYIDVTRDTHTALDVMLEKRKDDYWTADGDGELSDTWTRFTRFTILSENLSAYPCIICCFSCFFLSVSAVSCSQSVLLVPAHSVEQYLFLPV